VCAENFTATPSTGYSTAAACAHFDEICKPCHTKYLKATTAYVGGIACMSKGCAACYDESTFEAWLGATDGAQLRRRVDEAAFLAVPGHMLCTRVNCAGQIAGADGDTRTATCPACAAMICVDCLREGHDGVTCEQYAAQMPSDGVNVTTEQWINLVTRRCPQCHFRVLKNGGCPHMTCVRCKFGWCFGCLKQRGSYVQPGEHAQCARLSSEFEQNANRVMAELRNVEKTLARRRAREAQRARQEARAARNMALRLAPMPDVEVRSDFFDLDFAAPAAAAVVPAVVQPSAVPAETSATETWASVASEARVRQSLLGAVVRVRVPTVPRRTLALSS